MELSTSSRTRYIGQLLVLLLGVFAFRGLVVHEPFPLGPGGADQLEDWFFRPTGQSPTLIFGLSACLLYSRRRVLTTALSWPRRGGRGSLLLAPAAALYAWAIYVGAPDLLLISFVLVCLGTGAALGGKEGLKAIFLPAVFLLLLVPIPAILANQIVFPLQLANAKASTFILNELLGLPATSSGTIVTSGARTFHVIETCAGLRTMATMVMSAIIYADIFRRSRTETAILICAAPLVGALVNLARVLSLMLHPDGDIAAVHTLQGLVMMVLGVLLLAAIDSGLARRFPADRARLYRWAEPGDRPSDPDRRIGRRVLLPLGVIAAMALTSLAIQPWQPERTIWWAPYKLPTEMNGWVSAPISIDKNAMGSVIPNHSIRRLYTRGNSRIEAFVASDNLRERRTSLISEKTVLPESGFSIREQTPIVLDGINAEVEASLLQREFEQVLSYRWVMDASGLAVETLRAFLALDRSDLVPDRRLILVRISTSVRNTPGDRRRADAQLREFARTLSPHLEEIRQPGTL